MNTIQVIAGCAAMCAAAAAQTGVVRDGQPALECQNGDRILPIERVELKGSPAFRIPVRNAGWRWASHPGTLFVWAERIGFESQDPQASFEQSRADVRWGMNDDFITVQTARGEYKFLFLANKGSRQGYAWVRLFPGCASFANLAFSDFAAAERQFHDLTKGLPPLREAAQPTAAANIETLSNSSVVDMVAAKLPDEVIITKIQTSATNFDVSTASLAELSGKGVSSAVIKAMLLTPKAAPMVVPAARQTAPPATPTGVVAQRHALPYRCAEVKRFTAADGVEFDKKLNSTHTLALATDEVRSYLTKKGVVMQAVAEGAPVSDADAADCIVIEGKITYARWGFHTMSDPPRITMEIKISQRSDHAAIATITPTLKMLGGWFSNDEKFAQTVGSFVEESVKKTLK